MAQSDESAADVVMTPQKGEKSGEIQRGELLISALRREKIDANSARLAIQSMSKLLDFRLSRAGDRYVYRFSSGKKLAMLRYQRGLHVYEAVLGENGRYEARLVDIEQSQQAAAPIPPDEEVDVEQVVMAGAIGTPERQAPMPSDNPSADAASAQLDGLERADAGDPVQPVDPALAGRPSPDSEFPDHAGREFIERPSDMPNDLRDGTEDAESDIKDDLDSPGPAPELDDTLVRAEARPNIIQQPRPADSVQTVQIKCRPEESSLFTPGLVMLILGVGLFVFGLFTVILPGMRARRRCEAQGLCIVDSINVTSDQQIACVAYENTRCLILIMRDKMQFIAPCSGDVDELFDFLQSKTYWHEMAQHPLSDGKLASLVREYEARRRNPADSSPVHTQTVLGRGEDADFEEDYCDEANDDFKEDTDDEK